MMRFFALLRTMAQRRRLYVLTLAVVLPTAVLLVMQYRALRTLERTLPVYRRELMFQFLDTVASEVFRLCRDHAARALDVPAEAVASRNGNAWPAAAEHFSRQDFKGARRYFLVLATGENGRAGDVVLFYNPATRRMESDAEAEDARSIYVACAAFLIYIRAGTTNVQRAPIGVDRDPNHPMLLKFIFDADGRPVGMAGFLVDLNWLSQECVPQLIRRQLPIFFPEEAELAEVVLRVDDARVLYALRPAPEGPMEVSARLAPYFTRFGLGMRMRGRNATEWARRSLILNALLSVAMMLALAGALWWGWRAAARELKLSQMKTDFVANISHEFRTPLASILALAELMRLGRVKDADEVREFGHYIESQGHRVMHLVNGILDFARMEAGQTEYQFEPADLRETVNAALDVCAGRLKQSGHLIKLDAPPTLLVPKLDAVALTLALTNLLDNAIKYSDVGQEIAVRLTRQDGEVLLSVRDQGIGIARDEQARIFEKFYRVGTGLVHDVKGSGLGLTLVKHIVEAHGGRVTVESGLGRGSTFTIHLPDSPEP